MENRTEHPIIFSTDMVRAILDGHKTMTRRVCKNPKKSNDIQKAEWVERHQIAEQYSPYWTFKRECDKNHPRYGQRVPGNIIAIDSLYCPYGQVGDRLWVRETFTSLRKEHWIDEKRFAYKADMKDGDSERCRKELGYKWHPSIHMPRWASRITLEITAIRVERIQEIKYEDCLKESINTAEMNTVREVLVIQRFIRLWDYINARRGFGWTVNPWVWVIEFKRIQKPVVDKVDEVGTEGKL